MNLSFFKPPPSENFLQTKQDDNFPLYSTFYINYHEIVSTIGLNRLKQSIANGQWLHSRDGCAGNTS